MRKQILIGLQSDLTGNVLSISKGNVDLSTDSSITILGNHINMSAGQISISQNIEVYGKELNSHFGGVELIGNSKGNIVGQLIQAFENGTFTSGTATITISGAIINSSFEDVTAFEKFKFSKYIKTERENLSFGISKKEIKFNATNRTQIKFEKDEKQLNFDIIIKQLNFERV